MAKRWGGAVGLGLAALAAGFIASPALAASTDVPDGHWAAERIRYVSDEMGWMAFPDERFRPDEPMMRRDLARAVVSAFAPADAPDPAIAFGDMPPDDPDFGYANVAVARGWMTARRDLFRPNAAVPKRVMDRALVRALALRQEIDGLGDLASEDGYVFPKPPGFAEMILADQLKLHYNYSNEAGRELLPRTPVSRADAAYALAGAARAQGTWEAYALQRYRRVVLPAMSEEERQAVTFALRYAGYPYVWGGEWHRPNASQSTGGFDCSGLAWWVLRSADGTWDNSAHRPYEGWWLPERVSRHMAEAAPERLPLAGAAPLDLLFFDTDGGGKDWEAVDHVGVSLGGGWMIHSSGSRGGVTLDWIADGWWRDHFTWARRVTG